MKEYIQKLGQSIMLPVSILPVASILMGVGYWIDPAGMSGEGNNVLAAFMIQAGLAIISKLPILFAVGIATGMAKDKNGAAALSGLVGFLIITTLLSPETLTVLTKTPVESIDPAFKSISNVFVGIICGVVAAELYNRYNKTQLPQALAFFSGRRLIPILTAAAALVITIVLYFVWPVAYQALVSFGEAISGLGALGAGIYGFFNKMLIPTGLHHALNSVFWFDVAGINDIGNFWNSTGVKGVTGMYQAGYFPIMMFGLPGAALAMYKNAKDSKKAATASIMLAAAFSSFFTGITEPIEFTFMFLAPQLYIIHALLTGISMFIASFMHWTAGFSFSAGLIDYVLSYRMPLANKPYMLLVLGLVMFAVYYFIFDFVIKKFDLETPGREKDDLGTAPVTAESSTSSSPEAAMASEIYYALGENNNIDSVYNCITRLRLTLKDTDAVDQARIKRTGVAGINVIDKHNMQVVVGTKVQAVADELEEIMKQHGK